VQKPAKSSGTTNSQKTDSAKTDSDEPSTSDSDGAESDSAIQSLTGNGKAIKPKAKAEDAAKTEDEATSGDAVAPGLEDDGAPDPGQEQDAPAALAASDNSGDSGGLALTGANTIAVIGGAAVLLLIGFVVLATTRRRRPRTYWR
jgi:hypothetical protein